MTLQEVYEKYEPTIGIECHVQLKTKTKLFSGADNDARDQDPNTTVSPLCFGFPGVLPVLNSEALTLAVRAGLAMQAEIPRLSRFERKHYFYPDLPLGYQITQLAEPVIVGGLIDVPQLDGTSKHVRIHHAHLEADAGKLTHPSGSPKSYVDLNRAGTPLIEIVSEADMHSPAEARAYAQELYLLMKYADVTHGDLYHGNMRFDVNISLAPKGSDQLGTRAEIKNLNSFRSVEKAAEFECLRQAELLEKGETIVQETRGWNEDRQKTFSQRSKEDAHDYRYFPDADIPPVIIEPETVEEIRAQMPVLPPAYREAWSTLQVDNSVINWLLASPSSARLVYSLQQNRGDGVAKRVAQWFAGAASDEQFVQEVAESGNKTPIPGEWFSELVAMTDNNEVSVNSASVIFHEMLRSSRAPREIAEEKGLLQSNDMGELEAVVEAVLADPAATKAVEDIKAGNEKAIGFLVGQSMKQSQGKANPAVIQKIIREKLGL
jgi:aspartyl-tRNA(Asn)/glutamyl-tRNA(Gln) amidotransferase subunit B